MNDKPLTARMNCLLVRPRLMPQYCCTLIFIYLHLPLGSSIAGTLQATTATTGCVSLKIQLTGTSLRGSTVPYKLTVTNNCPKRIAAYSLDFTTYSMAGKVTNVGNLTQDLIWSFANPQTTHKGAGWIAGPLERGSTMVIEQRLPQAIGDPVIDVQLTAVMLLFEDNSWIGDRARAAFAFAKHAGAATELQAMIERVSTIGPDAPGLVEYAKQVMSQTTPSRTVNPSIAKRPGFLDGVMIARQAETSVLVQVNQLRLSQTELKHWLSEFLAKLKLKHDIHERYSKGAV